MAAESDKVARRNAELEKLNAAATEALRAGNAAAAKELLQQALSLEQKNPVLWLNLAAAHRALSDLPAAMTALDGALRADPRSYMALLMKGSLLERMGQPRQAGPVYGVALALAPPEQQMDEPTRRAMSRARDVHGRYVAELGSFIRQEIGIAGETHRSAESRRIDLFIDTTLRVKRNFRQEPTDFFYPGLPAVEFHERDEFPWLADLEAATQAIRGELLEILAGDSGFTPYIAYPDGAPLDQWAELNHSPRWSAFHFYHFGQRNEENCRRCPRTMEALAALPQPQVPNRMPAAMFSVLQPRTRIPPHTGVANVRLVTHLPLIVPPGCGFRVGNETRSWKPGEAWVFDDTIEHEAWNESDSPRVILICDIWNPRLSPGERELIGGMMLAMDRFNGTTMTMEL